MFLKKVAIFLLGLLFVTPTAGAMVLAADPAQEYLDDYKRAVDIYLSQQKENIEKLTKPARPGDSEQLEVFKKRFKIRMKSSSLTRAFRLAKEDLKAEIKEWTDEIASEGFTLVNDPKPVIEFEPRHGLKGFQYYVRLKLFLKLWAQKTQ